MPSTAPSSTYAQISRLAAERAVHQAFRWMHLNEKTIFGWQQKLVTLPAPPFEEALRAAWLAEQFRMLGLVEVEIDGADNAIGRLPGKTAAEHCVVLSAHIDTVFPADTPIEPYVKDRTLYAPGACDNGAGVAGMLAIAAALIQSGVAPDCDLYFIGNTGEEGEGNLRGVRHLYQQPRWKNRMRAHIILDGAGDHVAITEALGCVRFRATITGPGGHAWSNAGSLNPVVMLSRAIAQLSQLELPNQPRTTLNVGLIAGGTAINAIPERAEACFDLRSTNPGELLRLEVELHRAIEDEVAQSNLNYAARRAAQQPAFRSTCFQSGPPLSKQQASFRIEKIGERPPGSLPENALLYQQLLAVDRQLGLRTEPRTASTDANLPLSLGVPALTLGAGGSGGGIHTRKEWYDASNRELALRRILLLLLAAAQD